MSTLQALGRGGLSARGRGGRGRRGRPRSLPYNRNKFLQANFRFMVSDASDLQRHQADADLMLDWEDVLQVSVASLGSPPACAWVDAEGGCLQARVLQACLADMLQVGSHSMLFHGQRTERISASAGADAALHCPLFSEQAEWQSQRGTSSDYAQAGW